MTIKRYLWNLLISLDQLVNTLFLGNPDETISSRCGKKIRKVRKDPSVTCYFCGYLCYLLNIIDTNHCKESIEEDET